MRPMEAFMRRPLCGWLASALTSLSLLAFLCGCSRGGFVAPSDAQGGIRDASPLADLRADAARPDDAAAASDAGTPQDASPADLTLTPNTWTFGGTVFHAAVAVCQQVNPRLWMASVRSSSPYDCTLEVFFAGRPTRDGVYPASPAESSLPADKASIVLLNQRTGKNEQWNGLDSGQAVVQTVGSMLRIDVQNMITKGSAASVPPGTPNEPVWGALLCP